MPQNLPQEICNMWGKNKNDEPAEKTVLSLSDQVQRLLADADRVQEEKVALIEKITGEAARTEKQLKTSIIELEEKFDKLTLKRKIEEEDLAHMLKMKDERQTLEFDRKKMTLEMESQKALDAAQAIHSKELAEIVSAHNKEMKEAVVAQSTQLKEMYSEILGKLPDINASLRVCNDHKG